MSAPLIYLAGPITEHVGNDEAAINWREQARVALGRYGLAGLMPLRGEEGLEFVGLLGNAMRTDPAPGVNIFKTTVGTLQRDCWDVDRCDAIIFNLEGARTVSIGTMLELGRSSVRNIPRILVLSEADTANNPHDYGWVYELCPYRVNTLDEAVDACYHLFKNDCPDFTEYRIRP
jgi:nucleoside 2-deoxyribosyltransferase